MSEINLERYFSVAWRWLWLIVLATGIAAGISYRVSKAMTPTYRTSVTIMVGDSVTNPLVTLDDVNMSERFAAGYAELAQRPTVLQDTVSALKLPMSWQALSSQVLVNHVDLSQYFTIYVIDTNPARAKAIADELGHQLILKSPTSENARQLARRRQFIQQQLDELQFNIETAQKQLASEQASLATATSARDVLDRQDAIHALNSKIADWQKTYASLLKPQATIPPNGLSVVVPADIPVTPISPNVRSNVLVAAAAGLLISLGAVLAIEYVDDTVKTAEALADVTGRPVLSSIGRIRRTSDARQCLVTVREPDSQIAEDFRFLRTSLQFTCSGVQGARLFVTSPGPGEGKSVTSANLAVTFAAAGKRVVLVDADLRNPSLHKMFGVSNDLGLTTYLVGPDESGAPRSPELHAGQESGWSGLGFHLVETVVPGLRLLPAGAPAGNPAELVGSPRMASLLESLRDETDVVILDTAPVVPIADTSALAALGGSTILVVEANRTRSPAVKRSIENLERVGARVVGTVLNKALTPTIVPYQYGSAGQSSSTSRRPGLIHRIRGS